MEIIRNGKYGISSSNEFKEAVLLNKQYQKKNNFPIEKSSWYGKKKDSENWAEASSMADFYFLDEKERKHAVLETYKIIQYSPKIHESIHYDKWVIYHKELYNYVVKLMSEIKVTDFTY